MTDSISRDNREYRDRLEAKIGFLDLAADFNTRGHRRGRGWYVLDCHFTQATRHGEYRQALERPRQVQVSLGYIFFRQEDRTNAQNRLASSVLVSTAIHYLSIHRRYGRNVLPLHLSKSKPSCFSSFCYTRCLSNIGHTNRVYIVRFDFDSFLFSSSNDVVQKR